MEDRMQLMRANKLETGMARWRHWISFTLASKPRFTFISFMITIHFMFFFLFFISMSMFYCLEILVNILKLLKFNIYSYFILL